MCLSGVDAGVLYKKYVVSRGEMSKYRHISLVRVRGQVRYELVANGSKVRDGSDRDARLSVCGQTARTGASHYRLSLPPQKKDSLSQSKF